MKKIFLVAGLAGFMGLAVPAQVMPERKNDGVNKEYRTAKRGDVYRDLNLTADQQAKLKALNQESRAQMEAIRNDNALTNDQKKAKFETFRKDQRAKRDAIFTPEQKEKMEAKMKQDGKGRAGKADWKKGDGKREMKKGDATTKDRNGLSRRDNGKRSGWAEGLNLTADQQSKMKTLNEEVRTEMQSIRGNASLNQNQKRTAMQELLKETQLKRKQILTAEQMQKWEARNRQSQRERPGGRKTTDRI